LLVFPARTRDVHVAVDDDIGGISHGRTSESSGEVPQAGGWLRKGAFTVPLARSMSTSADANYQKLHGGECFEALSHERRQLVDARRPRELARRTAKRHDRCGADEKMDDGAVTPRAFQLETDGTARVWERVWLH
jgi:hypothetical protein